MTDTFIDPVSGLPQGAHPLDSSVPIHRDLDANLPVPADRPAIINPRTNKPFDKENAEALAVYQRAAKDWTAGLVIINAVGTLAVSNRVVVPRQKGRTKVSLWVPNQVVVNDQVIATTAGVMLASDKSELEGPTGTSNLMTVILNVGDSLDLPTEASVYCALIPGQSVGYVQFATFTNPPGGELGIY